jgi:hypothetical protein
VGEQAAGHPGPVDHPDRVHVHGAVLDVQGVDVEQRIERAGEARLLGEFPQRAVLGVLTRVEATAGKGPACGPVGRHQAGQQEPFSIVPADDVGGDPHPSLRHGGDAIATDLWTTPVPRDRIELMFD